MKAIFLFIIFLVILLLFCIMLKCIIYKNKIPKIIHQIWIGDKKRPDIWMDDWKIKYINSHPDWTYKLWTEKEIDSLFLINRDIYDMEKTPYGKADIARLEILYNYGGVYIDADCIWLNNKDLNELKSESGFFVGKEPSEKYDDLLANSVIGSSIKNPNLLLLIEELKETYYENRITNKAEVSFVSGPHFISGVLKEVDITIFPSYYFYPLYWLNNNTHLDRETIEERFPDSYMFQYGYSTNRLDKYINDS